MKDFELTGPTCSGVGANPFLLDYIPGRQVIITVFLTSEGSRWLRALCNHGSLTCIQVFRFQHKSDISIQY